MSRSKKFGCSLIVALFWFLFQGIAAKSENLISQEFVRPGYSSVQNAVRKEPHRQIWSSNRKYFAQTDPDTGTTVVNQVTWQGNIGRFKKYWSTNTGGEAAAISNAGEHMAVVYNGGILPMDYDRKQILLRFFIREKPIAQIELGTMVSDLGKLRQEDSGYYWGRCLGLNAADYYVVETVEKKTVLFDLKSGKPEEFRVGQSPAALGWKAFVDVMQWYEFQHPEEFSIEAYMGDSRVPSEVTFYKGELRNWIFRAIVEVMPDFSSNAKIDFEDFALDRFKAMNCADGPGGSRYIDGVAEKKNFVNPHNLKALELYLTMVDESMEENSERRVEKRTIGPVYAVLIAHPGEARRVVFFQMDPDSQDIQTVAGLLNKIVQTVKILR